MGIFNNIMGRSTRIQESMDTQTNLREALQAMSEANVRLQESASIAQLRLEDYAWSPVAGWNTGTFSIQTIRDEAEICRQLYAINPMIKKAVSARIGMIHGRGNRVTEIEGTNKAKIDQVIKLNYRKIFGPVGRASLEAELSTAGNVFVMREGAKPAQVIPLSQIIGYVSDVEDPTRVLYWKRSYSAQQTNITTGQEATVTVNEYIPAHDNLNVVTAIGDVKVRSTAKMFHVAANRQEGWVLGLPDLFAAKFWTKGHKEMFEAGHEFALAQGQVAATVKAGRGMGAQTVASRLADEPRRDMDTGEVYGYGGTLALGNGMEYQLMGKMGGGVDFKSYDRIAGLVAVGTGVPLSVLLGESDSEETSLEQSVIEDMKLRQELWSQFYEDFMGPLNVRVVWPRIKQETVYRTQQAIEIANRTNTLTKEEKRLIALEAFSIEGNPNEAPDINEHPDVQVYLAKKQIDLEYAPLIAAASVVPGSEDEEEEEDDSGRSTTPDQGNDQGIGKLSDGEDAHDARDNGEQEHTQ